MKYLIAVALLVFSSVVMGTVQAQTSLPTFASLVLKAEADKSEIRLGESLNLKLELTNPTSVSIDSFHFDASHGTLAVLISRNGGRFQRYLAPGWGTKQDITGANDLAAGSTVYSNLEILFNQTVRGRADLLDAEVAIDQPGIYQFKVTLTDDESQQKIAAAIVQVNVVFPTTSSEQAMWQEIRNNSELVYFMQTGDGERDQKVVDDALRLLRQYPTTIYETQLTLALGEYYLAQENFEEAARYLTRVDKSDVPAALRTQAKLRLAECYARLGEPEKSLRILDGADADYREKYLKQDFDRLRASLLELTSAPNSGNR